MSGPPKLTVVPEGVYRLDRPPETTAERARRRHFEAQMLAREHIGELRQSLEEAMTAAVKVSTGGEVFPPGMRDAAARTLEYLERQAQTLEAIIERDSRTQALSASTRRDIAPAVRIACLGVPSRREATIGFKASRLFYRVLGVVALGFAVLGAMLPVLPTTIFVLVAAWAFARSSPRLHQALRDDRRFGPLLRDWEAHGAIPRPAKIAAVASMGVSFLIVLLTADNWAAPAATAAVLLCAAVYVLTRPRPPPSFEPDPEEETQP